MIWGIGLRRLGWVCGGVWGLVVVCLFDVEPYGRPRLKPCVSLSVCLLPVWVSDIWPVGYGAVPFGALSPYRPRCQSALIACALHVQLCSMLHAYPAFFGQHHAHPTAKHPKPCSSGRHCGRTNRDSLALVGLAAANQTGYLRRYVAARGQRRGLPCLEWGILRCGSGRDGSFQRQRWGRRYRASRCAFRASHSGAVRRRMVNALENQRGWERPFPRPDAFRPRWWRARLGSLHTMLKASWDSTCDRRRCPGRASGADVPWHGLLSQNDGPSARPPRHALYGQRLEAPVRKRGARDDDHGRGARVDDHGRSRRRTRSAAAGGFELSSL